MRSERERTELIWLWRPCERGPPISCISHYKVKPARTLQSVTQPQTTAFNAPFQHLSSANRASISMVYHLYISQKFPLHSSTLSSNLAFLLHFVILLFPRRRYVHGLRREISHWLFLNAPKGVFQRRVEGWIETIRVDETVEILPVGVPDIDRAYHGGVQGGDCLDECDCCRQGGMLYLRPGPGVFEVVT